jgi:hypothetical protein
VHSFCQRLASTPQSEFGPVLFQLIPLCDVQGLYYLEMKERGLCRRIVETISLKQGDDFMLLSNVTFALRDVAQRKRLLAEGRRPVHA